MPLATHVGRRHKNHRMEQIRKLDNRMKPAQIPVPATEIQASHHHIVETLAPVEAGLLSIFLAN